jgi:hypothetical protein
MRKDRGFNRWELVTCGFAGHVDRKGADDDCLA